MSTSSAAMTPPANPYTTPVFWERLWRTGGIGAVAFFVIAYLIYGISRRSAPRPTRSSPSMTAAARGSSSPRSSPAWRSSISCGSQQRSGPRLRRPDRMAGARPLPHREGIAGCVCARVQADGVRIRNSGHRNRRWRSGVRVRRAAAARSRRHVLAAGSNWTLAKGDLRDDRNHAAGWH